MGWVCEEGTALLEKFEFFRVEMAYSDAFFVPNAGLAAGS